MSNVQARSSRRIISWQALLAVITAALLLPFLGLVAAYSALAGGMISVIGNTFFAARLFSNKGGWQAGQLTAAMYRGVIGKFLLTIALFIMAIVLLDPLNVTALFAVYLWIQLSPALIAGVLKV